MRQSRAILTSENRCSGPISRSIAVIRKTHPSRLLARILLIGCVATIVSGIGHVLANPTREQSQEMADLVVALSEGSNRVASVPSGVSSNLGYDPVTSNGTLAKPTGGCSTPIPLGPDSFEEACRTHDLGYDLLRSAEENGRRLGMWARFELDRRLYRDLLSTCETLRCRTAAATYYTAVTTNSIRQGYGAPTEEPATPWVGVGLLVVCFAVLSDPNNGLLAMARRVSKQTSTPLPVIQDPKRSNPPAEPDTRPKPIRQRGLITAIARGLTSPSRPHAWTHRAVRTE